MVNPDQLVTISLKEYRNLLLSDAELSALECWGVDNWGYYSDAYRDWETDRKSTRLNSSHSGEARMPSSA